MHLLPGCVSVSVSRTYLADTQSLWIASESSDFIEKNALHFKEINCIGKYLSKYLSLCIWKVMMALLSTQEIKRPSGGSKDFLILNGDMGK